MKKYVYLAGIVFIILSCKNKTEEEKRDVVYYPSKLYFNSSNLKRVTLQSSDNFIDIIKDVNRIHRNDSLPYIEVEEGNRIVKIILMRSDGGLKIRKNFLTMTKDSVYTLTRDYPLNRLNEVLRIQYENKGRVATLAERAGLVIVEIELDHYDSGERLIESLKMLITNFDSLNAQHKDSLELRIALSVPLIPLPLPPPSEN
ncbi:hypothetical protein ACKGJN_16205 [Gillisia sp. Q332]|uniref:hypothetical protein n=1 Tax=Gillisia xinjiangensis TaxID=3384765 RepID=UPI00391D3701